MLRFSIGKGSIIKKVTFGRNYDGPNVECRLHAEIDAFQKLRDQKRKNRKYYDLLVIRLTKSNKFGQSRPCCHCLKTLVRSGINIRFVYYSTADGTVVREKFNTMLESNKTYICYGYRQKFNKSSCI